MAAHRWAPERVVATATLAVALVVLAASWVLGPKHISTGDLALALCLIAAVAIAYRFPIYIRHNTKISVCSVPLYLMAVLLPAPLAATAAGCAIFTGEMAVRTQRGNALGDVATHAGRWIVVMLAGALVAHIPVPATSPFLGILLLLATAVVLLGGDILTVPLTVSLLAGDSAWQVVAACLRDGGVAEAAQYAVGIVGAVLVRYQVWTAVILAAPSVLLYLIYETSVDSDTLQLLESMADAVDLRDPYTIEHSRRVADLTQGILGELGTRGQEAAFVLAAARLHDIGKMKVPDQVLLKTSPLSAEERILMEGHAAAGAEILGEYPDLARAVEMVRHHHERWDGSGYPAGLAGTAIPFGARVIAVANGYDELTRDTPFRRALPAERAVEIVREGCGRQWDPSIIEVFLRSLGQIEEREDDAPPLVAIDDPVLSMSVGQTT
jgi:putative nucleotidyltransferase with HDIG domain